MDKYSLPEREAMQAIFEAAWEHILVKQREPSYEGDSCQYLSMNESLMCAFGPAIMDYTESMEGCPASELLVSYTARLHPWARACPHAFADSLQNCHDANAAEEAGSDGEFLLRFEGDMRQLAYLYHLEVPDDD